MVPTRATSVFQLPRNANGNIDRRAAQQIIEAEIAHSEVA
jgi:hypothetical protein